MTDAGLRLGKFYSDIDESRLKNESAKRYAVRLAYLKALKCADTILKKGGERPVVIGVDTVIAYGRDILGKPKNRNEAARFLKTLSGKWHEVYTGVAVLDIKTGKALTKLMVSRVKFAKLSRRMIKWYISTGEPMKAAGAYSIQGKGRALIESVGGCFTNVIGISIPVVMKMLARLGAVVL